MPEEKKLGPNVTYTNPDKGAKLTTVAGVLLKEGQAVDFVKKLGPAKAEPILKKLAGNRYFKVDGGPDHSKDAQAEADTAVNVDQANWAVSEEARIRAKEGDEAADKFVASVDEYGNAKPEKEHPHGEPPGQAKKPQPKEAEENANPNPSRREPR